MKRFNEFIKQLSLTQQLFALVFFFVTFFAVFFFVYVNGSINGAIREQQFELLDKTQRNLIMNNQTEMANEEILYFSASGIDSMTVRIAEKDGQNVIIVDPVVADILKIDPSSAEWKKIGKDAIYIAENKDDLYNAHGTVQNANEDLNKDSFYCITKLDNDYMLISRTYSDNLGKLQNILINSVVYITVIVVGFFFIILLMWVLTLLHPLNQIRNYIEKIKLGKDAELKLNRKDEIGELADALVAMRDELRKQEKTKEEMIHNISHDLKTPIATIKSYGESIKDGIYPYETLEKSVDVIIENADRLEQKVHSLLFMNRVEYLISQDCEGIRTDMKDTIELVIQNIKVIKPEIEIKTEPQETFFDGLSEPWRVVVENIIENALRYSKTTIEIHLNEEEGLTIANDGPCMEEDRIKTLFKPYEMGQGGRFGLGLSIVAKVCSANHYEVCGENTADGVIFRIYREKDSDKKR